MNDMKDQQYDSELSASLYIRRLSLWLVTVSGLLMVLALLNQSADIETIDGLKLMNADLDLVARMEWGSVFLVATVWIFFICAFRSLGKRKEWARKATIGIFSVLAFSFVWNGILTLLLSATTLRVESGVMPNLGWPGRIFLIFIGLLLLVLAWVFWKLILKLRTQVIRRLFLYQK
jgi:hypothetical protein